MTERPVNRCSTFGTCFAVLLTLAACASGTGPHLPQRRVQQLADAELRLRLGHYYHAPDYSHPILRYFAEKRSWVVSYPRPNQRYSDVTVEVDDRTGKAAVWMP